MNSVGFTTETRSNHDDVAAFNGWWDFSSFTVDPNTKRFKRTLTYFNIDTQYKIFGKIAFIKPQNDT